MHLSTCENLLLCICLAVKATLAVSCRARTSRCVLWHGRLFVCCYSDDRIVGLSRTRLATSISPRHVTVNSFSVFWRRAQRLVVKSLHGLPRFGHPDNFSSLLSSEAAERKEYTDGIIAFGVFLAVFAFVWSLVLLVLKYTLKEKRVGCAAGGRVQDVTEMRNHKLTRSARKKRILRNWRTQIFFIGCTVLIPTLSFLLVNHGLNTFFDSLDEVKELSGSAREMAVSGIGLATDITYSQNRVNSLLLSLQPSNVCPNFDSNGTGLDDQSVFGSFNSTLQRGMNQIDEFVSDRVSSIVLGLSKVSHLSNYVQSSVQATESYDWLVKGFLIALNTINVFLFIGVCLTRCSLHHPLYQQFLTWLAVPAFCAVLCGSVVAVVVASALSVANADFCSGGVNATSAPHGSPLGTLLEIFEQKGYNESHLPHQALQYYGQVRASRTGAFECCSSIRRSETHARALSLVSLGRNATATTRFSSSTTSKSRWSCKPTMSMIC
jgi:hypothetical protein